MKLKPLKLLLASAKKPFQATVRKQLGRFPGEVHVAGLDHLISRLHQENPDCLLLALERISELSDGLLEAIKKVDENLPIIILAASKDVEEVVRLMKAGIYDYLVFPSEEARLQKTIQNAFRFYELTKRVFLLENQLGVSSKLDEMVGASPGMQTIFQTIQNVAKTNSTILIMGESGTGKELVAKAIHRASPRNTRRFIDINCGAIPRELLENELFGHERGAYTGADRRYIGCCERADGGSLFLDEISEMDPALQVKLLRFLQERQFMRVGGTEPIKVDVRIIAATNRNLNEAVAQNQFREDLFYRLNVVQIVLPPLRERKEDIPLLAKHFLEKYAHRNEKIFLDFTQEAMEKLINYDWPGNIRELENTIERAVVLHNDTKVKQHHLPEFLRNAESGKGASPAISRSLSTEEAKVLPLIQVERYAIEQALKICTGNVAQAARRLRIGQATLYRKIKQYGIRA